MRNGDGWASRIAATASEFPDRANPSITRSVSSSTTTPCFSARDAPSTIAGDRHPSVAASYVARRARSTARIGETRVDALGAVAERRDVVVAVRGGDRRLHRVAGGGRPRDRTVERLPAHALAVVVVDLGEDGGVVLLAVLVAGERRAVPRVHPL